MQRSRQGILLVVSPTHAEGPKPSRTQSAPSLRRPRQARSERSERAFTRLVQVSASEAEAEASHTYRPGDVIVFHQNAKGFTKGDRLTVADPAAVPVELAAGCPLPARKPRPGEARQDPLYRPELSKNSSALDAAEATAKVPEADPDNMSVGYGGLPDRDGFVTLDACVMDHLGNAGSVTYLQHIMHPVSVARKVMEKTPHVMLSGDGALQFALQQGFVKQNLLTDKAKAAWEEWKKLSKYEPVVNVERHDTIGILALDSNNNLSGACRYQRPGL